MSGLENLTGTQVEPTKPVRKREIKTPEGFKDVNDFLIDMRRKFDEGVQANQPNRDAGIEDIRFVTGDQWDPVVADRRRKKNRPVLTINRLPAFVGQVVNQRLMNETSIRVLPDVGGSKAVAQIRQGIIQNIYKNSDADVARDEAMKYQVVCGEGYFTLKIDYASNDVFEQDIRLNMIADPYSVVMDPLSVEPTGADARYAFVGDEIPTKDFKIMYPDVPVLDYGSSTSWSQPGMWYQQDTVRVVSYWHMVDGPIKVLALMQNGTTQDVTDVPEDQWRPFVKTRPNGEPYIREVPRKIARLYICSGGDILDGPFDYEMSSIPVYRVPGWEMRLTDRVYRWGLVRFLKDPMRLHNFWRSTLAEQLVAAPRNKWLATKAAISGYEKQWRTANLSDDPLLIYNEDAMPPTQLPPPPLDPALVNEANTAVQDIRDVSNIHEASFGIASNEVSGKAIQARQQVSDVGTFIYQDRLRMADERCARNINELIPQVYDTQRIVKIMGADNKEVLQTINDPANPETDVTTGKYLVSVTTGPSTVTKRQLAAEQMETFVNAMPQVAPLVMDLIAEAQDWPQSDEFARRFRTQLPPALLNQDDITPQQAQAMQAAQQLQQAQQQLEQAKQQADILKTQADAAEAQARAIQLRAAAEKALADAHARVQDVQSKTEERTTKQITQLASTQQDMHDSAAEMEFQKVNALFDHAASLAEIHNSLNQGMESDNANQQQ